LADQQGAQQPTPKAGAVVWGRGDFTRCGWGIFHWKFLMIFLRCPARLLSLNIFSLDDEGAIVGSAMFLPFVLGEADLKP
jgi:hypothetical protein